MEEGEGSPGKDGRRGGTQGTNVIPRVVQLSRWVSVRVAGSGDGVEEGAEEGRGE